MTDDRITVGPDGIRVYGPTPEPDYDICGCGHHKSFHSYSGTGGCWRISCGKICDCMVYVPDRRVLPLTKNRKWSNFQMTVIVLLAVIAILLIAVIAGHAQALPAGQSPSGARFLADAEIGSASGLGFRLPDLGFGMTAEIPIKSRWEAQGAFKWSPDDKYLTGNGNEARIGALGLFWLNKWLAASGQERFSRLWTTAFNKNVWAPSAGAVIRDRWFGAPGRVYFDYVFATGCQWAAPGHPCPIQSNRESGIEFNQEFRFYAHWRVGIKGAWVRFADQGNQNQPGPRVWNNSGTFDMALRYEFRGVPTDQPY